MIKLTLKIRILFVLFTIFLFASAILFNFEEMFLAGLSFGVTIVLAILLVIAHKKELK